MGENITIPTPEEIAAAEASVAEIASKLESANAELVAAGKKGNVDALVAAVDAVKSLKTQLANGERNLTNAKALLANAGRLAARDKAQAEVESFLQNAVEVMAAFELGCTRIDITRAEDGTYNVNVATGLVNHPNKSRKQKGESTGTSKPRTTWIYNGSEYSSRQLLEQFGGADGIAAVRLATKDANDPQSWVNAIQKNGKAYTFSPGFNAEVVALAEKIGATKSA